MIVTHEWSSVVANPKETAYPFAETLHTSQDLCPLVHAGHEPENKVSDSTEKVD